MITADQVALALLDQIVGQAEHLLIELEALDIVPRAAVQAAKEVAADLHDRRRLVLDAMMQDTFDPPTETAFLD